MNLIEDVEYITDKASKARDALDVIHDFVRDLIMDSENRTDEIVHDLEKGIGYVTDGVRKAVQLARKLDKEADA